MKDEAKYTFTRDFFMLLPDKERAKKAWEELAGVDCDALNFDSFKEYDACVNKFFSCYQKLKVNTWHNENGGIGITTETAKKIGSKIRFSYIEKQVGDKVQQGDEIGEMVGDNGRVDIISPLDGIIQSIEHTGAIESGEEERTVLCVIRVTYPG